MAFDYGAGATGDINFLFFSGESRGLGISPQGCVYLHDLFPPMPGFAEKQGVSTPNFQNNTGKMPEKMEAQLPAYLLADSASFTEDQRSLKGYKARQMFPGGLYKGSSAIVKFNARGELGK